MWLELSSVLLPPVQTVVPGPVTIAAVGAVVAVGDLVWSRGIRLQLGFILLKPNSVITQTHSDKHDGLIGRDSGTLTCEGTARLPLKARAFQP